VREAEKKETSGDKGDADLPLFYETPAGTRCPCREHPPEFVNFDKSTLLVYVMQHSHARQRGGTRGQLFRPESTGSPRALESSIDIAGVSARGYLLLLRHSRDMHSARYTFISSLLRPSGRFGQTCSLLLCRIAYRSQRRSEREMSDITETYPTPRDDQSSVIRKVCCLPRDERRKNIASFDRNGQKFEDGPLASGLLVPQRRAIK